MRRTARPHSLERSVARVVVDVMLKPEILDPQGQAIHKALGRLGFAGVHDVRAGKRFEVSVSDALAADPQVHVRTGGSFSSGELARDYGFTDLDGSAPDCWRYMVEVQDPGLPADPSGYR